MVDRNNESNIRVLSKINSKRRNQMGYILLVEREGVSSTFIMAEIDADATGLLPMHACIGTLNCCRGIKSLSLLQMIFPEI